MTGARGFAGSHLVEHLRQSGVHVTPWARQDVDLLDREAVRRAIATLKPDVVYHCAGVAHVGQSFNNVSDTFAANVLGTHHLLEALRLAGVKARVLVTGSSLVYRQSDRALSEDVAQDTFVEIFRALPSYRAHGKFSSYLYRVLLNRCHMTWRSSRAEQRALEYACEETTEIPELEVLLRERRRDLRVALGELSEKLRSVVLLRYSAGLSYDEIAETLEIPMGTVKRRLFDAMTKLRDSLEGA